MAGKRVSALLFLLIIVSFPLAMWAQGGFAGLTAPKWGELRSGAFAARVEQTFQERFPAREELSNFAWNLRYRTGAKEIDGYYVTGSSIIKNVGSPSSQLVERNNEILLAFAERARLPSYLLLTPIFFANIGIRVELPAMSWEIVLFSVLLVAVAVLSKLIGCGLGARLSGFRGRQCVQVGVGMACRGEVALIVANKGMAMGLMPSAFFGPVIIMVVCCAILTPILLKLSFRKEDAYSDLQGSNLLDSYEAVDQLDRVAEGVLTAEQDLRQGTGKQE